MKPAAEIIEEGPVPASPEKQEKEQIVLTPPNQLFTNRYKNVIIITHVDMDGFRSTLRHVIKHYYWNHLTRGNVQILTATPTSLKFVLEHKVTPLLWNTRDTYNKIIVSDFDIDIFLEDKTFFKNLRHDYLQEVRNDASRLEFHWYDHHILKTFKSADLHQFHEPFSIQFHHDTSMETYHIIAMEMEAELRFYDRVLKCQVIIGVIGLFSLFLRLTQIIQYQKNSYMHKKLAEIHLLTPNEEFNAHNFCEYLRVFRRLLLSQYPENLQNCHPIYNYNEELIGQLQKFCGSLDFDVRLGKPPKSRRPRDPALDRKRCDPWVFYKRLQRGENTEYLRKWGGWFEEYTSGMEVRPQYSWFNFFKGVLSEREPPLERKPPKDPEEILYCSKIFTTKNDIPIGVHVFYRWFSVKRTYKLLKQIYGFVPPINFFYWLDYSTSLWSSSGLDLSGYLAYFDVFMHAGAGRIRNLQEKLFQIGKEQVLSYLYSSRTLKECVAWSCQLNVTNEPADFSQGEIQIIPEDTRPLYEIFGEFIAPQYAERFFFRLPLPERDPFVFYPGDVTLLYSRIQKIGGNVASNFLHHLLCVYLEQYANKVNSERRYEVSFIKTNIGGQQLQDDRLLRQGLSHRQLRKVLKTAPLDWPTLKTFVDRSLCNIILTTRANLIVLWRPFALIWKHLKTLDKYTRWKRYAQASAALVAALQAIASKTGAHILLLLNYVYSDTQNPYLPWETRHRLRHMIYVKWTDKGFESLVQERQEGSIWGDSDKFTIAPLPLIDRSQVLETVSGFTRGIDLALPPNIAQKIPNFQEKGIQTVAPISEKTKEEWEELWGEEEAEPELEVEVEVDVGLLYPEDEEKLREPPAMKSTAYGLQFLLWWFRTDKTAVKNLSALLRNYPQERDFDLILWADQNYDIYNSVYLLDLFETYFGAAPCPKGSQTGQAVCFTHEFPGVHPFEKFLQRLELLFIDFRQLSAFLKQVRKKFIATEPAPKHTATSRSHAKFTAKEFESIFLRILPIFGSFPPYPPWNVQENWEQFLQDLGQVFPWDHVRILTEVLLENLQRYHTEQRRVGILDPDKLKDSLRKALQAPLQAEKPKIPLDLTFTPIPIQEDHRQKYPEISSIESIPTPMIPIFPILRFVFRRYRSPKDVAVFRANLSIARIFDICLYAKDQQKKRKYHIFSNVVNLNCLKQFGGIGSKTNIYFRYGEDQRVDRFDDFLKEFLALDPTEFPFLGWESFRKFLSFTRDEMQARETREGLAAPPVDHPPYTNAAVSHLRKEIHLILTHSQPTLAELTSWSEVIQELRTYFGWGKIWDITETILSEIDIFKGDPDDRDIMIEAAIIDGLKRGLPPEKS